MNGTCLQLANCLTNATCSSSADYLKMYIIGTLCSVGSVMKLMDTFEILYFVRISKMIQSGETLPTLLDYTNSLDDTCKYDLDVPSQYNIHSLIKLLILTNHIPLKHLFVNYFPNTTKAGNFNICYQ